MRARAALVEEAVGSGFDVEKFVENFEVLVEATGSAKLLRELVLQLAVTGRLSSARGESAEPLLAKLRSERPKLAKAGVRIAEASGAVSDEEAPYPLPLGWRWTRLRDLGGFLGGGTPAKANEAFWNGPLPWVSPKDMKRPYIDDAEDHISMAAVEGSAVKLIPARSVLCVVRGMILAHSFPVAVTTREVTINQDMKALVLALPEISEFVLRSCQAARARVLAKVERSSHGTCRLESEAVEMLPIALPPLAEQKRIVAKVDQLMALCDELEARQTKKRETGARLTKSALEALTSAEGPEEFDAAWKRVVENFEVLADRAETALELRKAVLELGVRGHLVGSRADDDGVPDFVTADESPFPLPSQWRWGRLECLASDIVDCLHATPRYTGSGLPAIRTADVIPGRMLIDRARLLDEDQLRDRIRRLEPKEGDIFYSREGERLGIAACVPAGARVCLSQRMMHIRVRSPLVPQFVMWAMNSRFVYGQAVGDTGGSTSPHINMKDIRRFLVPIPPPRHQKRIVVKVEQLMKICDDLEAKLRRAEDRAARLVEAVVREMVA